ncbi:TIGR03905 family TSCPD domain-containing protein [Pectinatus sottacetonis]|uniref:TIGR03905 family TSCPD domain-containing protein n=1 Tax=Pectinatus sottacetonis TaxID=1002795 RepID=UPI001E304A48|nr:TIGR03905 family TSCPD domain-containing protein [Pectinatus sottacetonis]
MVILKNLSFIGGCDGNLKGICSITRGMKATDVIEKFSGIKCGPHSTFYPDQLSKALQQALKNN